MGVLNVGSARTNTYCTTTMGVLNVGCARTDTYCTMNSLLCIDSSSVLPC